MQTPESENPLTNIDRAEINCDAFALGMVYSTGTTSLISNLDECHLAITRMKEAASAEERAKEQFKTSLLQFEQMAGAIEVSLYHIAFAREA